MAVSFRCPNPACQAHFTLPTPPIGRSFSCPQCGQRIRVSAAMAAAPPAQASDVPERIGRFQIRQRLGAGSFGIVYRAYDPQLEREVALKVARPDKLDTPQRVERFLREARAAARLQHPHLVPVFEAGQDGAQLFIAYAFIAGRSLAEVRDSNGLDRHAAVRIVRALAEALAYAHRHKIIHRDVKPANIMIDEQGQPYLMDFGVAHLQDSGPRLTRVGAVLGTPAYMPPEQARGKAIALPASDQYSLGVILYELLTGRLPFAGTPDLLVFHAVNTAPPPLRTVEPNVPQELEAICLKTLAKEPEQRYADCQQLADALGAWQEGTARPGPLAWCRRHPRYTAAAGTALALVATVGLFLGLSQSADPPHVPTVVAESSKIPATPPRGEPELRAGPKPLPAPPPAVQPKIKQQVKQEAKWEVKKEGPQAKADPSDDLLIRAEKALAAARFEEAIKWFEQVREKRPKSAEMGLQKVRALQVNQLLKSGQADLEAGRYQEAANALRKAEKMAPADAAITKRLQETRTRCALQFLEARSARLQQAEQAAKQDRYPEALKAADEAVLLANEAFNLAPSGPLPTVVRLAEARQTRTNLQKQADLYRRTLVTQARLVKHKGYVTCVAYSPDGKLLASGGMEGAIHLWEVATAKHLRAMKTTNTKHVWCLAFDGTGRRLASCGWDKYVHIWDPATGRELRKLRHDYYVLGVAYSPNGKVLASCGGSPDVKLPAGELKLWNVRGTNSPRRVLSGHKAAVHGVAFSPDGSLLVSASSDRTAIVWDTVTGKPKARLQGHQDAVRAVAFSPDGKNIATGGLDSRIKFWDVDTFLEKTSLKGDNAQIRGLAFSHDSRWLASASGRQAAVGKALKVWDVATAKEVSFLPGQVRSLNSVAFSPNGWPLAGACADGSVYLWCPRE